MKFFKFTDIILIVVLLAVAFFAHRALSQGTTLIAEILVDGKTVEQIDLQGVEGEYFLNFNNTCIEVCRGKIRFADSDCADKTCIHGGWLSSAGAFSACLPNKVAVRVLGAGSPDAVTG